MIVQAVRSTLFYLLFFVQTIVWAIVVGLMTRLTPDRQDIGWRIALFWDATTLFLLRWVAGVRSQVTGMENIPEGGCIIASKHMSDWDIYAILPRVEKPAFIAKKELLDIPLFGWAARWLHTISVDRKRGRNAFPLMLEEAREKLSQGCRIVIFPEGTRKAPLEEPAYRSGLARMYIELGVPVVPVALTSGLYWGRNSLVLWPGTARAKFLPAISAGLDQDTFQQVLEETIERETNAMILEDARKGLSRPITPRLRSRLDALEQAAAHQA